MPTSAPTPGAQTPVFDRMARNVEKYKFNKRVAQELNEIQKYMDPMTGKEFFKPEINRNVEVRNRPQSMRQVTDNLHMRHKLT